MPEMMSGVMAPLTTASMPKERQRAISASPRSAELEASSMALIASSERVSILMEELDEMGTLLVRERVAPFPGGIPLSLVCGCPCLPVVVETQLLA